MEFSNKGWYIIAVIIWIFSVISILLLTLLTGGMKTMGEEYTFVELVELPDATGSIIVPTTYPPWYLVSLVTEMVGSFGYSMSTNGNLISVGSPQDGLMYTYETDDNIIQPASILSGSTGNVGEQTAVNKKGDNILSTGGAGYIFSFVLNTDDLWQIRQKISLPDALDTSDFGQKSLVYSGSGNRFFANLKGTIINPSRGIVLLGEKSLSGVVWEISNVQLYPSVSTLEFGTSVCSNMSGTIVVIGDPGYNEEKGAIYEFQNNIESWKSTESILGIEMGSRFGQSSSMSENGLILVVGAPGRSNANGMVHIYSRNTRLTHWVSVQKIKSVEIGLNFGTSLSMTKDGVWIAIGESGLGGSVYLYNIASGKYVQNSKINTSQDVPVSELLTNQIQIISDGIEASLFLTTSGPNSGSVLWYSFTPVL
jgi:hypothetical protein